MMKTYLKRAFQLSDSGVKGLAKSIWSFFLYYVSFVPPMICVFLFADRLLNGNTGKPVVYLLFMLAATLVMYLVINYNYKTTYDETYQESANLRIDLAEQLSKLPLSYFSKHNLSDLAQTIMADTMRIEAGVQFLFSKAPICKGFHIPFNESRLYGNREMVAVELFCIFAYVLFNYRS